MKTGTRIRGIYSINSKTVIHPALALRPSRVPENVGLNKKLYSHRKYGVGVTERSQPKGVRAKMRQRKL